MGGFRYNGCGVTDHFKTIKSLGTYTCPNCKKLTEFSLDEANQKIDILWIPTLTLKSRYAVMCRKCKNGEFCSAEWAGYLMNQSAHQEIIFESKAKERGWSPMTKSFQGDVSQKSGTSLPAGAAPQAQPLSERQSVPMPPMPEGLGQSDSGSGKAFAEKPVPIKPIQSAALHGTAGSADIPQFFKCAYCGVTQMREGNICSYCGKPAPMAATAEREPIHRPQPPAPPIRPQQSASQEPPMPPIKPQPPILQEKPMSKAHSASVNSRNVCPSCGTEQEKGNKFCTRCGRKLILDPPKVKFCTYCGSEITEGSLFCGKCGTKVV